MDKLQHFDIFPWNKSLETGIAIIDEQHKVLVGLINKIAKDISFGTTQEEFDKSVVEVVNYTKYHFQTEEKVWAKYFFNESSLQAHIRGHSNLVGTITTNIEKFKTQSLEQSTEDLLSLLTHWLTNHILDSDMRMSFAVEAIEAGHSLENAQEIADKQMTGVMSVIIETSLFLYDNLCTQTLAYNREMNHRKKLDQKIYSNIKQHEFVNSKINIAQHSNLIGISKDHTFNQFNYNIQKKSELSGTKASLIIRVDGLFEHIQKQGQSIGDGLLEIVTERIQICLTGSDILTRISYCNFSIFYNEIKNKLQLDENISELMRVLSEPIPFNNDLVRIYATIDTTLYPEGSCIEDELLMKANNAIYSSLSAKQELNHSDNEEQKGINIKLQKLTPREQDVLELVVTGKTNKAIAVDLNISVKTVELHRSRVMKKMEVKTLAELVKNILINKSNSH